MWEKDKESVKLAKQITEELYSIWKDKDFCKEILTAIDGDLDIAKDILKVLKEFDNLVPADIYDILDENLPNGCIKEFSLLSKLKRKCIKVGDDESWRSLFETLKTETCYKVIEWDLTEEEKKQFEGAKVGDTLHIETPRRPLLLMGDTDDEYIVPVFTSMYEIDREYRGGVYSISETTFGHMKGLFDIVKMQNPKVKIILDVDSLKQLEITSEIIDKYW